MKFKNLNSSPIAFSDPKWQIEIIKEIENNPEILAAAIEADKQFTAAMAAISETAAAGYHATALFDAIRDIPRYTYIKNINGGTYDVEIDLLLHTVSFNEI